ncbi:unnamed protein product [Cuscuta campestris]|uniref:Retrotransposon Copia-like N-terminal domain-containing protein n=1 Tax=Cuscuta campestris TaxID=132261 RepID=A0A484MG67_9ASTE|nr:unnamed protein product [Cuscuta campestris]
MAKTADPLDDLPTGLKLFIKNLHSLTAEKLDDTNFLSWLSTVSANLSAHRLMGHVDGSIVPPPPTVRTADKDGNVSSVPNPEYEKWSVIDAQLCACLLAIITPSVQTTLLAHTSAQAIWNQLQLRYNSLSLTHIFQLKEQLHNIHKGTDSMQKYLDEIAKIVASLHRAKSEISDQDVILCILRGLPPDYGSIKQNICTNIGTVTLTEVTSWLIQEELNLQMEQKLQLKESSTTDVHTALYTNSSFRRGRGGRFPYRGCGGRGAATGRSFAAQNSGRGQSSERASSRGSYSCGRGPAYRDSVICQICGGPRSVNLVTAPGPIKHPRQIAHYKKPNESPI